MSIENTKSMIDALDAGDTVSAEKEFKAALADKVGSELDTKRKDLAGILILLSYSVNLTVSVIGSSIIFSLTGTGPLFGISPKYPSTSFLVFSISISPATTKTALFGLFH